MKLLGPILALATIYFVFIYHDGALFMQLADRLGDWLANQLMDNVQQ